MLKKISKVFQNFKYDFKSSFIHFINKRILEKFNLVIEKKNVLNLKEESDYEKFLCTSNKYSMCSFDDRKNIIDCINYIARNNIKGDFVECGVWKGGNLILCQIMSDHLKLERRILGFDLFDDMPDGNKYDVDKFGRKPFYYKNHPEAKNAWCKSSIDELSINLSKFFKNHKINLIKGDICITLQENKNIPSEISLLRLDTDFYDSTKCELNILFPKLSSGGILIIDDYNEWQGCRKAVDEYFFNKNIFFHQIPNGGVYLIKD